MESYSNESVQDSIDSIDLTLESLLEENIIEQVYGESIRKAQLELDNMRADIINVESVQNYIANMELNVDTMKNELHQMTKELGL